MYSSTLTKDHPKYDPISRESNTEHYYEAIQVNVNEIGFYTVLQIGSLAMSSYLYEHDFYLYLPLKNLLSNQDNGCNGHPSGLTVQLLSNIRYILVVTTCFPMQTGNFTIKVLGKNSISFQRLSEYFMTRKMTTNEYILNR